MKIIEPSVALEDEKELDKTSNKEFNEVLALLSHTNCKNKVCDCNVNGKCIRSSNDKENTKIGVCWHEIGEGEYQICVIYDRGITVNEVMEGILNIQQRLKIDQEIRKMKNK